MSVPSSSEPTGGAASTADEASTNQLPMGETIDEGTDLVSFAFPVKPQWLRPTPGHSWFTLIGMSFLCFEIIFLCFYGSDFWFGWNVSWLGLPIILVALGVTHLFLSWNETSGGCVFFSPIKKGSPLFVYRRWVSIDDEAMQFGNRRIKWPAIDETALTIFGNLMVRSRSLCGPVPPIADLILKFPFAVAPAQAQQEFMQTLQRKHPDVVMNARLKKRLTAKDVRGTALVQSFGSVFMLLILLDVGQATFGFLEMQKDYYLSQTEVRDGHPKEAQGLFDTAEYQRTHALPFSWVNNKLLSQGVVASGVYENRADALWRLGRKEEAIESLKKSVEFAPDHYRVHLHLARFLTESGKDKEARAAISEALKNHYDSFLPRLYMLANLIARGDTQRAMLFYDVYLQDMQDVLFGEEPMWPPGGNRFAHEMFFQDDLRYIFDRVLKGKTEKAETR